MKKFCVFSGFLGSGKTTAMMALTKYFSAHHGRAAMISNDLGSQSLADNRLAQLEGCLAREMVNDCICYQTENLVDMLDSLFEGEGCSLVISDIPGFGVGALDHVYHTLNRDYAGRYELAPFTVLVEKSTVDALRGSGESDLGYILNAQLQEADLIVLSKCDLLSTAERDDCLGWLRDNYPQATALTISAITGEGLEELSQALISRSASMRLPDIGYGGEAFGKAMGRISELYIQYYATICCDDFDGSAYLMALADYIQSSAKILGRDIPHLKLLAWDAEGDYGKVDLLGIGRDVVLTHAFEKRCSEISVMVNASADCPAAELERMVDEALDIISIDYMLALMYFKRECFGMGG